MVYLLLGLLIIIVSLFYLVYFVYYINQAKKLVAISKPFQRIKKSSQIRILIIGDSTAVGTGLRDNRQSIAGILSRDYPKAHIENIAKNGARLRDFLKFQSLFNRYDHILIHLGANDIMRVTPIKEIERDLKILLDRAKEKSRDVIILHSGNVGFAPFFLWPFSWFYSNRTAKVRKIYLKVTKDLGVKFVDIYSIDTSNPKFAKSRDIYSDDKLHLTAKGYSIWREDIHKFSGL